VTNGFIGNGASNIVVLAIPDDGNSVTVNDPLFGMEKF